MSKSNRRVVRTVYQILIALTIATPIVVGGLPDDVSNEALVVGFAAWVAVIARIVNTLEDAGIIPAWLKDES